MINVDDRLLNELDESEMYLVLHIAKHMKSTRMTAWPSLDTLSKACNWDERTVKKHRQSLIDKGYLHMKMQPGKPTMYRFLKKGIGVYSGLESDEMIAENEGANIEGGTKNEGTQNAKEGVQKMRGVRVQKMYPEVIKEVNKKEVIKEDAAGPLSPPFTETGLVIGIHEKETPGCVIVDFLTLEAEKEKKPSPGAGPKIKPGKSGRAKQTRSEPQIHPENEVAFQHFNDPEKARAAWVQWIKYKFEQFRDKYKSGDSELICLRKHWKDTNGDAAAFEKNISHSIGSLYKGIFPPKEEKVNGTKPANGNYLNVAQRQHLNLANVVAKYRQAAMDVRNGNGTVGGAPTDWEV